MEVLEYGFMQRALLASLMVGLVAPAVGVFLVQRRLSLLGDGLGHVALTGVAIGVLTRAVVVDHGRIAYDGPLAGAAVEVEVAAGGHHHPEGTGLPPGRGYRQDQPRVTTGGRR